MTYGKFEAEPPIVKHLWETTIAYSMADLTVYEGDTPIDIVRLKPKEQAEFNCNAFAVALWESDSGFVYSRFFHSEDELEDALADLERDEPQAESMEGA